MNKKEICLNHLYKDYIETFKDEEIVLGQGNLDCKLMLIGEAPGKDEVKQGQPFVGKAGKNLSHFLDCIDVLRKDIYITNAIKYRLSSISVKTKRKINRPAKKNDIIDSRDCLIKEINLINPPIIATLGNVPLRSILGKYNISIGDYHGEPIKIIIGNNNYILVPLYHPASIIYNISLKDVYIKDLYKLRKVLNS